MASHAKKAHSIKIKYVFSDDYNPVHATGALGGPAPNGDIIVNFFIERMPLPKSQTVSITPEGKLGEILANEPDDYPDTIVRAITAGLILNLNAARSLHEWLGNNIKAVESREQSTQGGHE